MDEKDIENLKDLHFTITESMKDTSIEMATTRQILDECELSKKDRKLFEKHFEKLKYMFAKEMQEQNPMQVAIITYPYLRGNKNNQKYTKDTCINS